MMFLYKGSSHRKHNIFAMSTDPHNVLPEEKKCKKKKKKKKKSEA